MTLRGRVVRLEHLRERQARKAGQRWWWELPPEQWHLGAVGLSHEEALAVLGELDAADEAESA